MERYGTRAITCCRVVIKLTNTKTLHRAGATCRVSLIAGGISNFTATVQNDSPVDFAGGVAKIKFINQDGSDYAELEVYIPELKVGTTNTIDAGTTADIANAFDFSIELEK